MLLTSSLMKLHVNQFSIYCCIFMQNAMLRFSLTSVYINSNDRILCNIYIIANFPQSIRSLLINNLSNISHQVCLAQRHSYEYLPCTNNTERQLDCICNVTAAQKVEHYAQQHTHMCYSSNWSRRGFALWRLKPGFLKKNYHY